MIVRNPGLMRDFEKEQIRASKADYRENLRIFEHLFEEARALGAFPLEDPLEGIEKDIRLVRALNVRGASRSHHLAT